MVSVTNNKGTRSALFSATGFFLLVRSMLLCWRDGAEYTNHFGVEAFITSDGRAKPMIRPGMLASIGNLVNKPRYAADRPSSGTATHSGSVLEATRSRRFSENAEGPLYVNDKCINCSACSMFAPTVFARATTSDTHHFVTKQPISEQEIEESRAALDACPVAAIRVEKSTPQQKQSRPPSRFGISPKDNERPRSFPRKVSANLPDVYFVGHHNSKSFGATPYLISTALPSSSAVPKWIMVDTPRYSPSAVQAVESVTGPMGPAYLVLTHVDDTADHNRWKSHYPNLKRVFHSGDLGVHNWIGDETLEDVEILLDSRSSDNRLQFFGLNGSPIDVEKDAARDEGVVLVHTPGHSPGSIAVLKRPASSTTAALDSEMTQGVLFSGDTYSYTTREGGHMSGFPRYGNDPKLQAKILPMLLDLDWKVLAPGHGHVRDYTLVKNDAHDNDPRTEEMEAAIEELSQYF